MRVLRLSLVEKLAISQTEHSRKWMNRSDCLEIQWMNWNLSPCESGIIKSQLTYTYNQGPRKEGLEGSEGTSRYFQNDQAGISFWCPQGSERGQDHSLSNGLKPPAYILLQRSSYNLFGDLIPDLLKPKQTVNRLSFDQVCTAAQYAHRGGLNNVEFSVQMGFSLQ